MVARSLDTRIFAMASQTQMQAPANRLPTENRRWWQVLFGCDLRSLAVFRVALGILAVFDAGLRWPDLEALFSDSGFFTRQFAQQYYDQTAGSGWSQAIWSVHSISGDVRYVTALFVLQVVAGVALAFGAWTRLSTIVTWVLVASAQARSPLVITSGDMLFKLLLLWSIFLPLGRIWSVDAWRSGRTVANEPHLWRCNLATTGVILQVVIMYFFTGVAKFNSIWFEGTAMDFVWRLDIFANPWGKWFLSFTALNQIIAWATLFIELVAIWLLFIPWRNAFWRVSIMAAYWMFHLGIALTMTIGLFPLICMVAWLPMWPAECWRRVARPVPSDSNDREPIWRHWAGIAGNAFCGLLIALMVCWNLYNMNAAWTKPLMPKPAHYIGHWTGFYQHFQMFGIPPKVNPWFVFEAKLNDGSTVDIFCTDGVLNYKKPLLVRDTLPSHNWRRLLQNMLHDDMAFLRAPLLEYAIRKWNMAHDPERHVRSARLVNYMQELGPQYREGDWVSRVWAVYPGETHDPGQALEDLLNRMLDRPF